MSTQTLAAKVGVISDLPLVKEATTLASHIFNYAKGEQTTSFLCHLLDMIHLSPLSLISYGSLTRFTANDTNRSGRNGSASSHRNY